MLTMTPALGAFDPARRGYHAVYRDNEVNHCPGCGRTHWLIGRTTAECGFCATALPLSESMRRGREFFVQTHGAAPAHAA